MKKLPPKSLPAGCAGLRHECRVYSRRSEATGPSRSPCDVLSGVAQTVPNTLNANGSAWFLPSSNTGVQRDGEKLCERTLTERVSGEHVEADLQVRGKGGPGQAPVGSSHLSPLVSRTVT